MKLVPLISVPLSFSKPQADELFLKALERLGTDLVPGTNYFAFWYYKKRPSSHQYVLVQPELDSDQVLNQITAAAPPEAGFILHGMTEKRNLNAIFYFKIDHKKRTWYMMAVLNRETLNWKMLNQSDASSILELISNTGTYIPTEDQVHACLKEPDNQPELSSVN